jgi:sulfite oxidase
MTTQIHNRPDQWKFEQGLLAHELPILDQTGPETVEIEPHKWEGPSKDDVAIEAVGDKDKLFAVEREGWKGYVTFHIPFKPSGVKRPAK